MRTITFKINEADDGRQIRDFLRSFGVSSALLTKLKHTENGITVGGEFAKAIDILHEGDELKIRIAENGKTPEPSGFPIEIVYEDEDIIVANKPPFMPVHESRNHRGDALSNAVSPYLGENASFRAVYRLDRDTSGLVLVAKNELAAAKLAGRIEKDYYAVVCGKYDGGGTVDAPIKRVGDSIIKRCVDEGGERAVTHYTAIKSNEKYTLLRINLETGRTHQIRVHFSHLGTPLAGDTLYGEASEIINRQALHCGAIRFIHPVSGEKISLQCDLPIEFEKLV